MYSYHAFQHSYFRVDCPWSPHWKVLPHMPPSCPEEAENLTPRFQDGACLPYTRNRTCNSVSSRRNPAHTCPNHSPTHNKWSSWQGQASKKSTGAPGHRPNAGRSHRATRHQKHNQSSTNSPPPQLCTPQTPEAAAEGERTPRGVRINL